MTAIREALDAASKAGVPVVWAGCIRYNGYYSVYACDATNSQLLTDRAAADLTVAAIKRGLVAMECTVEVMYMPNGAAHVEIHRDGKRTIMETAVDELSALAAALKGMALSAQVPATDGR